MTDPADPVDVVLLAIANPQCQCEYVNIGVGFQKVSEDPTCPKCTLFGEAAAVVDALIKAGLLTAAPPTTQEPTPKDGTP